MIPATQLHLDSVMFPADRRVLTVRECAAALGCCDQHIVNLIESGDLAALNIATSFTGSRVPSAWLARLAPRLGLTEAALAGEIAAARVEHPERRPSYRIPATAWTEFLPRCSTLAPR